ncbi:MAG: threonine synthase, partial [Bacteroidota bacterium]
ISGYSFNDDDTKGVMKEVHKKYGYVLDPHGAIGYSGLKKQLERSGGTGVFLETAHPAKFIDTVTEVIGKIEIPERLSAYLKKEKKSHLVKNEFNELKSYLID